MERGSPSTGLIALGVVTAVGQAALLREAMAALGGSELAWGAVLALWLTGTGAGAWLGAARRRLRWPGALPGAVLVLAFAGVLVLRAAPALAGLITGEAAATWRLLWLWCAAILPAAAAGGFGFALLAERLRGAGAAGSAYALEAAGAFVGGSLFTFALASAGSASALVTVAGLVLAGQLCGTRRWLPAVVAVGLGVLASAPIGRWVEISAWRWSGRVGALREWRETREQRLEVAGEEIRTLYADGRLVASYPDPWRIAPQAHLLMLLHPDPRRVLAVGAVADGSLPALLRHVASEITVIEEDPGLLAVVREGGTTELREALGDARVHVVTGDPMRALAQSPGAYDLVLLLDGDPATLRRNRTRTLEFFRTCRDKLDRGGLVAVRVGVSDTYLGGVGGRLLGVLSATLGAAGLGVAAIPGDAVVLVGSLSGRAVAIDADTLKARLEQRRVVDPVFDGAMVDLLVEASRIPDLRRFIGDVDAPANTAEHPRVVLLAAALSEGRGSPGLVRLVLGLVDAPPALFWAAVAFLAGIVLLAGIAGRGVGFMSGAVLGASSMTWWLLLLAAWQSKLGSVYAEVGLLSGLFMAGVACGAMAARRSRFEESRGLGLVVAAGACVSCLLASGAPLWTPYALVAPLLIVTGMLTGAGFPAVARLSGGVDAGGVGRAFGADEIGAGIAALGIGLIGIPWMGMFRVAVGLAVVQGAAVVGLMLVARRTA